jgi:gliding motility-associated-like protein
MAKNFSALLVLFIVTLNAQAQRVGNIQVKSGTTLRSAAVACGYEAGEVMLTDSDGNIIPDSVVFLPFGDSIAISAINFVFEGDPDTTTEAGVVYLFYECPASVDSTTIQDIAADPCRLADPFFYLMNGDSIPRTDSFWVNTIGDRFGNLTVVNDGFFQTGFGNGDPFQLWLAPATIDDFASRAYEAGGACVDVSSEEAFSIVYLNEIRLINSNNNTDGGGCTGSFTLDGGLPEFDPAASYDVTVRLQTDSSVTGTIFSQGRVRAQDSIPFFVPQPGTYVFDVRDAAGSTLSFTQDMSGCELVNFQFPLENRLQGEDFCFPLTVTNFNDIGVLEFDVNWDADVLELTNVTDLNTDLQLSLPLNFNTANTLNGDLPFSWFTPTGSNISLMDNDTVFTLCFTVIGQLGDQSPVELIPSDEANNTVGRDQGANGLSQVGYVFDNGQVNISDSPVFFDVRKSDISCNPINDGPTDDGSISITLAQGNAPYDITYQNLTIGTAPTVVSRQDRETLILNNLEAGDYQFDVIDQAGFMLDTTITIVQPEGFSVGTDVQSDISCFMGADGVLTARILDENNLQIPNPETRFTFAWNTGDSTVSITGLEAGQYEVTVTDQNGCMASSGNPLSARPPIQLSVDVLQAATCTGIPDGGATISATGGEPGGGGAYTFTWETGQTDSTATQSVLSGLGPGFYTVSMTDDLGCVQVDSIEVTAQKTLSLSETLQDITCFGDESGEITVAATANNSEAVPYNFVINGPGSGTPTNSTDRMVTYTGLAPGLYTVQATDNDGCIVTEDYTLFEPDLLTVAEDSTSGETCPVGMDGFASVEVSGGTGPYTYQWDDPAASTDSFATNLVADTLLVIVTDVNSCIDSAEIIILPQGGPIITAFANDSVSCSGDTDGLLSVQAIPGNTPIVNYEWSTGNSGPAVTEIINLSPGVYNLTITDQEGCQAIAAAAVVDPAPLLIDSIAATAPLCPGFNNGSLAVFPSGGTMPYTYTWGDSNPPTTNNLNLRPGLAAGSYGVTVVDANNCPAVTFTSVINDPPSIQVDFQDIVGVACAEGDASGEARAIASLSDGSPQLFDFNWSNGLMVDDTTEVFTNTLPAGFNTVIVFDENGCSTIDSVNIPSPEAILLTLNADAPSCNGLTDGSVSVAASGGTPGYNYLWQQTGDTNENIMGLGAGVYTVEITDANGCLKSDSVSLVEPDPLQLSINTNLTEDPRCADTQDGVIAVTVNNNDNINPLGAAPFTWSDNIAPATDSIANGLSAGTYMVTVTDTEGCTDSISYTLTQPTPISFSFQQPADPPCFGDATFFSIDNITGGAGMTLLDYTYQIDNNGISFPPDQQATVFAGTRIITVEDFNGCTASDTITINQPDELTVTFDPAVIEVELGDTLTQLNPIVNTTQIDSLAWSPTESLSNSNTLTPIVVPTGDQQYELRVVDVNGCSAEGSVLVELNRSRNVYLPNVFSPNGDGRNDEFRLFACKGVQNINYARVFDRWGNLLYSEDNIGLPDCAGGTILWDGTLNNQDLPAGVYVYIIEIEFIDNVTLVYPGDITLIH